MSAAYADIILDEGLGPWFKWTILISTALHLAVILLGFIVLPGLTSGRGHLPPIYTVKLVSLSPMTAHVSTPKKTVVAKSAKVPAFIPPKEKAELIPLGPVKKASKKKTDITKMKKEPPKSKPARRVDPSRDIDRALARVKTSIQKKQRTNERIDSAIARLAGKASSGKSSTAYGLQGTGARSELDVKLGEYLIVLHNVINANWNMPPAGLIRKKGPLEAIYVIQIAPSGTIIRGWFERKSGDKYFDQSAEKAVARSTPLPPLPKEFKGQNFEVGLRFTPSGLTNNE